MLEHLFLADLLKAMWPTPVEIMKPQVDDSGYDLVLEANGILRHIQLKSSFMGATTAFQKVHIRLGEKPGGCVVWMLFQSATLEFDSFLWFGGKPGDPLPDLNKHKVARHTKANATGHKAERPMIRVIPRGRFEPLNKAEKLDKSEALKKLTEKLFGQIPEPE